MAYTFPSQQGGQQNQRLGTPPPPAPTQAPSPWAAQPATSQTYFGAAPTGSVQQNMQQAPPAQAGSLANMAAQFAQQAGYQAVPNVQAQRGAAQGMLAQGYQQGLDQARMSAAQRGTLQSGTQGVAERKAYDNYIGGLSNAYNQIAQNAQQQGFQNLLGTSNALGNLSNMLSGNDQFDRNLALQRELGLGNLDVNRMTASGNLALGGRRLDEDVRQFDKNFGLQEKQFDLSQAGQAAAQANASRAYDLQLANAQASRESDYLKTLLGLL